MIRTRFAPSPSAVLHVGSARTALFNWLYAKQNDGQFILRIDDTDRNRNQEAVIEPILKGLRWLGLNWDEGPEVQSKTSCGPYFQSERTELYRLVIPKLIRAGVAHSEDGALYLNIPDNKTITIQDMVRGEVSWNSDNLTKNKKVALVRKDGSVLYNFATVIDDYAMKISHIFRSEEHLPNTPIQMLIYEALEWEPPVFGHLPYVCEPNSNKKMSKRKMDKYITKETTDLLTTLGYEGLIGESLNPATLEYYRLVGYMPEALVNYLALLGWSTGNNTEYMTPAEIIENFSVERVNKSPAAFDPVKCLWLNSQHLKNASSKNKVQICKNYLERTGKCDFSAAYPDLEEVIKSHGERLKVYSDILNVSFFFHPVKYDKKAFEKRVVPHTGLLKKFMPVLGVMDFDVKQLDICTHNYCKTTNVKINDLVHALRIAVTGISNGPGLFDCLSLFGKAETLRRIRAALEKCEKVKV